MNTAIELQGNVQADALATTQEILRGLADTELVLVGGGEFVLVGS
jgi:hypothetical protein